MFWKDVNVAYVYTFEIWFIKCMWQLSCASIRCFGNIFYEAHIYNTL